MSDQETFLNMLTNRGFNFTLTVDANKFITVLLEPDSELVNSKRKINGYIGFYTDFTFDHEGDLINIGIWE